MKIISKFKIIYLNNSANTYHYQLLKPSNYLTMTTNNLIHYIYMVINYLIGILEYINNQVNQDNQPNNKLNNQQVRILSNKVVDNLPEELSNLEIVELSTSSLENNKNNDINDKKV